MLQRWYVEDVVSIEIGLELIDLMMIVIVRDSFRCGHGHSSARV